jgi:hypothetical protein
VLPSLIEAEGAQPRPFDPLNEDHLFSIALEWVLENHRNCAVGLRHWSSPFRRWARRSMLSFSIASTALRIWA